MSLNDAAMQAAATYLQSILTHMEIYSDDPGEAGLLNTTAAARESIVWTAPVLDGDFDLANVILFTGLTPGQDCRYIGLWDAVAGGIFYGSFLLTGDTTANANGEYPVHTLPLNGSSA